MKTVDKQVNTGDNFPLNQNGGGLVPEHRMPSAQAVKNSCGAFLIAILLLMGARSAFAEDLPNNPPLVPVTISGTTYQHVIYNDIDNNGTYTVIFYNGSAVTTDAAHAGSDCSSGCPTVASTGYIGSSYNVAYSGDTTKSSYMLKGTTNVDQRYYYGCHSDFTSCTYYGGTGGASGWLNGTLGSNKTTNIHSDLAVYDFGPAGGGGIGCILNCAAPNTSTRFEDTTPLNNAIVSSTTPVTVGATVYINPADYSSGMYLNISFTNETVAALGGSALDAWNAAWGTGSTGGFPAIQIPITASSTDLSLSTTTSNFVRDGRVTALYTVQSPNKWSSLWFIGSFFSGSTVISTTTQFVVGEKTDYDIALDNGGAGLANTILFGTTTAGISTSTVQALTEACIPSLNFNLYGCLKGLIIPDTNTLSSAFGQARDGFLSYFPFGYVTRFYNIISGTATSSLPSLSVTVPAGFPAAGDTLNLTPWGHLMGTGSYLATATSTATGHTFESTFETYWDDFVYFVFGVGVVLRLVGMSSTLTFGFGGKKEQQAVQNKKTKR